MRSFTKCGLQQVAFPSSLKVIAKGAFCECRHLKDVELNEGLEKLGYNSSEDEKELNGLVFAGAGIESIRIPSTLKVIEAATFLECKNLKSVEFSESLEKIGVAAFS